MDFIKTICGMLKNFGSYDSNVFGKYLRVTLDTQDNEILEQNLKRKMFEFGKFKQTSGKPMDNLTTIEKYEHVCNDEDGVDFSCVMITFPGIEHDELIGIKSCASKMGGDYSRRDVIIVGFPK